MSADTETPWLGLLAYEERDAPFFFGRARDVEALLALVARETLTVLYGVSGLGKTSLLCAGLFPWLEGADYFPVYIRIDHGYVEQCEMALVERPVPPPLGAGRIGGHVLAAVDRRIEETGIDAPRVDAGGHAIPTLWEFFHQRGHGFWSTRNRLLTPVLVFDQLEELFTHGRASSARVQRAEAFLDELADLLENRPPAPVRAAVERGEEVSFEFEPVPVRVILALREDFLPELGALRARFPTIRRNELRLLPFSMAQAREVIERPAPRLLAPGFADALLGFLAGASVADVPASEAGGQGLATRAVPGGDAVEAQGVTVIEPALLSVLLSELNTERLAAGTVQLTADQLRRDKDRILADFYRRAFEGLERGASVFVESELVTASGFRDSRAVEDALTRPGITQAALDTLVDRRLLRYEERAGGLRRVEFTHDLLCSVARAARREREAEEKRVREEAQARAESEREAAERARVVAEAARDHAARLQRALEGGEAARRLARRRTAVAGIVAVVAVITAAAAIGAYRLAVRERTRANEEARQSLARRLASLALYNQDREPEVALRLAGEGVGVEATAETKGTLLGVLQRHPYVPRRLGRVSAAVLGIAFDQSGGTLVVGDGEGTLNRWDIDAGMRRGEPIRGQGKVGALAVARDGAMAMAGGNGRVVLRDATGAAQRTLDEQGPAVSVALSPDGRILALGDQAAGTLSLWDVGTQVVRRGGPRGELGEIDGIAFSPDGAKVAAARADGRIVWWEVAAPERQGEVPGRGGVRSIAWSPDGTLAAGNKDGTIDLWDIAAGRQLGGPLLGHDLPVSAVAFAPDAARLVSGDAGGKILLWDVGLAAWRSRACRMAGRPLTDDERTRFLGSVGHGDVNYEPACQSPAAVDGDSKTSEEPKTGGGRAVPEGMVGVPAEWFWMGCSQEVDGDCFAGDTWRHVYVDAFAIDRTEVTVAQYRRCVEAEGCTEPDKGSFCNWGREGRENHPVNCVDWQQATQFCEWEGRRLPREAEWEKAARGENGWKYPWGNAGFGAATKKWANIADESAQRELPNVVPFIAEGYEDGFATTAPVGSFPDGASPYGALDMAGNVAECVWDKTIDGRGLRGGSWFNLPLDARASRRIALLPRGLDNLLGFRCVQ